MALNIYGLFDATGWVVCLDLWEPLFYFDSIFISFCESFILLWDFEFIGLEFTLKVTVYLILVDFFLKWGFDYEPKVLLDGWLVIPPFLLFVGLYILLELETPTVSDYITLYCNWTIPCLALFIISIKSSTKAFLLIIKLWLQINFFCKYFVVA